MIGVTGATGHLGRRIVDLLPDAVPIHRDLPQRRLDAIIHTAAPDYRNTIDVLRFRRFNEDLEHWVEFHRPDMIVSVGSWWEFATGTCEGLAYTKMKQAQARLFPTAAHVIPYSIYGDESRPGRGFIPHLVNAINGKANILGLSSEFRDFIHVTDVALACIAALYADPGTYAAATWEPISPANLAGEYNLTAPDYEEFPTAEPHYKHAPVPYWRHTIDLREHIDAHLYSSGRGLSSHRSRR